MLIWLIWAISVVVLAVAGLASILVVRNGSRQGGTDDATSVARAAVASAEVSRDGCGREIPVADELLQRASMMLADNVGVADAKQASALAARADQLWRAAGG